MAKKCFFLIKSEFFFKKYLQYKDFFVTLQAYSEEGTKNSHY